MEQRQTDHNMLYYLFRQDQAEHPMAPDKAEALRAAVGAALDAALPAGRRRVRRSGFSLRAEGDGPDRTGSRMLLRQL